MLETPTNGHSLYHGPTNVPVISADPLSSQKTHGVQPIETPDPTIDFAYNITIERRLLVTSPTKLSLEQMQELQRRFEEEGYQVTELKYEGVVES